VPSGRGGFAAEAGRYRLYVSLACPWAHRTWSFEPLRASTISSPFQWCTGTWSAMAGWTFADGEGATLDSEWECWDVASALHPGKSHL